MTRPRADRLIDCIAACLLVWMMLFLAYGCASTVETVVAPIAQPETDDAFHECILNLLTLWANERVAVAQATSTDAGLTGTDRDSKSGAVQTEGSIMVTQRQLAAVVSACSVTAEQMARFRNMQLDCFDTATCDLVINWPAIMDTLNPEKSEEN